MMLLRLTILFGSTMVCGVAGAACRTPENVERVVYSQTYQNEQRSGVLAYKVVGTTSVCEYGKPGTAIRPDTRNCVVGIVDRKMIRSVEVKLPSGKVVSMGESTSTQPNVDQRYDHNCNRVLDAGRLNEKREEALGNKASWQKQIDDDWSDVKSVLEIADLIKG